MLIYWHFSLKLQLLVKCPLGTLHIGTKEGSLSSEIVEAYWGYDSIGAKIGYEETVDFSNGTKYDFKFIGDYKKVCFFSFSIC